MKIFCEDGGGGVGAGVGTIGSTRGRCGNGLELAATVEDEKGGGLPASRENKLFMTIS